jgi:hypothetical protein
MLKISSLSRLRTLPLLLSSVSLLSVTSAFAQEAAPTAPPATAPVEAAPAPATTEAAPAPAPETSAAPVAAETAATAEPLAAEAPPVDAAPAAPPKPPPYSIPFGLRPALAVNVVRLDTALGLFKDPVSGKSGSTFVGTLLASKKIGDSVSALVRLGMVSNTPPDTAMDPGSGTGFMNPVIGINYMHKVDDFRITPFLGMAFPLGSGGGDKPDAAQALARNDGIFTRSAMDNAMFAVNDFVIFPGLDIAYIKSGLTLQIEATVLQLRRVRGNDMVQPDAMRTNFTGGFHAGYFFVPAFSFGAELRHQRWLSTPAAVKANDKLRENTTFAFGPRFHIKVTETAWLRPAITYTVPLDDPMSDREYKIIQLDIPFIY